MPSGELFIVSAPSGAGKSTLITEMMARVVGAEGGIAFSTSHTTRPPRQGERPGVDYHFVDRDRFEEMIAGDRFLEWAEVHDHLYGTTLDEVLPRLEGGIDVVLDIDVQGAEGVRRRMPGAHGIFILPPSFAALEERLRARGLDDDAQIARRLSVSRWEMERYKNYQYVIINDDLERASQALAAIILDKRCRLERIEERVVRLLEEFGRARGCS